MGYFILSCYKNKHPFNLEIEKLRLREAKQLDKITQFISGGAYIPVISFSFF